MRVGFLILALATLVGTALVLARIYPPNRLIMAAGPANGAYERVARRYREVLARDGIELEIVHTTGSGENARLLAREQVDAALIQDGIQVPGSNVETIGALFFEPMLFLAHRDRPVPGNPATWQNLRINIGPPGSGTAAAFADFETVVGLGRETNRLFDMGYEAAIRALGQGDLDIAVFVAPTDAPYLSGAYENDQLMLVPLEHAKTISRRLKYASTVVIPTGALSLSPPVPAQPRELIALEARLAIGADLHPALVNRLTMAAMELHGGRGLITDPGMFPSATGTELPVDKVARQLIQDGPSIWHDWLPYWVASQLQRLVLLMLPIIIIVLPALRALPLLYAYLMRWKIWRYYPEIRRIEDRITGLTDTATLERMDAMLVELDERLSRALFPAAYKQAAYDARMHIELVRNRIDEKRREPG